MAIIDSEQQIIVGNRPNDSRSFPDNWQLRSLGEITTSSQYGISSSSGGNYSVPILKMNNLQEGQIDFRDLDYIQLSKAEMESLILNKGDLLINRTNSIDLVGKAAIYDLEGEHVFASYLVRFRLGPSVLPTFVNYYLNSEPGQRKLKLLATQGVSQANINPSNLKKRLFIPIPPILEQQRIVEILYALDDSINLTTQLIAKKRDIKQATMQQLLTGKTRLPEFSGEWQVKKLGEIAYINMGQSPDSKNYNAKGIGMTLIQGNADIENRKSISRVWTTQITKTCKQGDLIMTVRAPVGSIGIATKDSCLGRGVCSLKCISDDYHFIFHSLVFFEDKWKIFEQGSTFASANSSQIAEFPLSIPDAIEEQQAIATILSDMDAEIVALEQKRDKMRALKQGMMQELLSGKTRLV